MVNTKPKPHTASAGMSELLAEAGAQEIIYVHQTQDLCVF